MADVSALEKYPCAACGAQAAWNPSKQALVCSFCGTRQVRHVRWEPASGEVRHFFDDEPVAGTHGVSSDLLKEIEPFPTAELVPYDTAFLSGPEELVEDRGAGAAGADRGYAGGGGAGVAFTCYVLRATCYVLGAQEDDGGR